MYFFQLVFSLFCIQSSLFGMQQVLTREKTSQEISQNFADEQLKAALDTLLIFEEEGVYKNITVSPNGELIASADDNGLIVVVDVETGAWKCRLPGHVKADLLVWSPKGTHLASHTIDDSIYLWDVQNGNCIDAFQQTAEDEMNRPSLHVELISFFKKHKKSAMAIIFLTAAELLYKLSQ